MRASAAVQPWRPEARALRAGLATRRAAQPRPRPGAVASALSPARERGRQLVVRLVLLLLLMAMLEGAVRKWVAPQLGAYIFFVRDPVLLATYALAFRHGLWPRRSRWLRVFGWMAVVGVVVLLMQWATGGPSDQRLTLGLYGWRAYFLYPPLALLVGATFRRADTLRLAKLLLWLAIPVGVLVVLQFAAPQGAPINVGIAEEKELQFRGLGLTVERTRPQGPFASGAAQQQFVATAFLLLLTAFMSPKRLPQPNLPTLLMTGAGVLTCIGLSGSRGLVLQCAVAVLVAQMVGVAGRSGALKGRAFIWPAVLTVAALSAYPLVFPEGYAAFSARWAAADATERQTFEDTGVIGRALYGLVDFLHLVDQVPVLGSGLGFGGNAAITLGARIDGQPPPYAESDFARHMVDLGPLFGMGYVLMRLALVAWLTRMALRATRRLGDPLPLMLWSYVAYVLVMGQITGQGTINFFGWLFAGLLIASCSAPMPARATSKAIPRATLGDLPRRTTFQLRGTS